MIKHLRIRRTLRQHSPQHHHPQHHLQDPQTNKWHTATTHRGSLRHPNKIPTTKPTRRTPWNGLPHLTLTTYSTDNIHSTDNTLNWQHTPLATHSTGNTLYRQNALPTTRSPTDSTLSRTRQQHLHPGHILQSQSPLSYVHSYSRTTGFLSSLLHVLRTLTTPVLKMHLTPLHKFRVLLLNARTQPSFDQTDDWRWRRSVSFFLSLSLHFYLSSPPFFSRSLLGQ